MAMFRVRKAVRAVLNGRQLTRQQTIERALPIAPRGTTADDVNEAIEQMRRNGEVESVAGILLLHQRSDEEIWSDLLSGRF